MTVRVGRRGGKLIIGAPAWSAWRYILGPVVAFRHLVGCRSHAGLCKASAAGSHHEGTEVGRYVRSLCAHPSTRSLRTACVEHGLPTGCCAVVDNTPRGLREAGRVPTTKPGGQPCTAMLGTRSTTVRLPYERRGQV